MENNIKMVTTLTDEQLDLLKQHSAISNGDCYFMPFWFKQIEGDRYEMLPINSLPPNMSWEIDVVRRQLSDEGFIIKMNN